MDQADGSNSRVFPWFGFRVARSAGLNCTDMKPTVLVRRK